MKIIEAARPSDKYCLTFCNHRITNYKSKKQLAIETFRRGTLADLDEFLVRYHFRNIYMCHLV